ncbi:(6-4)DNA photolyase [Vigna angularis]|uniref:(6-4)DNA photolyase n=1 Tax=Phaseolus angularis TaxID=3914 RepID=A0A8T0JNE8_PHAAN|nr:(6-4)DNA photolyase [Vigna angularis]
MGNNNSTWRKSRNVASQKQQLRISIWKRKLVFKERREEEDSVQTFTFAIVPSMMGSGSGSLVWFRKGIRIHDNPALEFASRSASHLYPVFVIDPHYMKPDPDAFSPGSSRAGLNRIKFLLESLVDLDLNLKNLGSRLLILKGDPAEVWNVSKLCFEYDTEPYYQALDVKVKNFALAAGIEVFSPVSHTLFNPTDIIQKNGGKPPLSYQSFVKLAGEPPSPLTTVYSSLPPVGHLGSCDISEVPTITDLGYGDAEQKWVANFEKPKGNPSAFLKPATTVLSPYLKFGCLSSRYFYQRIQDIYRSMPKHTSPPVSLTGQLLWREFFYTAAFGTPNFDRMKGNRICKQFVHWEKGRDVFERLLIDSDWAINNGNWMWLSCSSFFYQYNRIYSPTTFGKKYDPNGDYIRHFLPVLKDMPKEYIYEPWTAPKSIQTKANCIIGKDYPIPASKECRRKMGEAYALNKELNGLVGEDDLKNLRRKLDESERQEPEGKRYKQKLIG